MDTTKIPLPGVSPTTGDPQTVPRRDAEDPAAKPAAGTPLPAATPQPGKSTVIPFGGNSGGKPRLDGLVPGSKEAWEEDKKKDRERKAAAKAVAVKLKPLPSAPDSRSGVGKADADPRQAPPVEICPAPGPVTVAWATADFEFVAEDVVNLLEEYRLNGHKKSLEPLGLDAATASKILREARWPELSKKALIRGLPESLAEIFNAVHVPVVLKKHLLTVPAALRILQHEAGVSATIEKLVREFKAKETPAKP